MVPLDPDRVTKMRSPAGSAVEGSGNCEPPVCVMLRFVVLHHSPLLLVARVTSFSGLDQMGASI